MNKASNFGTLMGKHAAGMAGLPDIASNAMGAAKPHPHPVRRSKQAPLMPQAPQAPVAPPPSPVNTPTTIQSMPAAPGGTLGVAAGAAAGTNASGWNRGAPNGSVEPAGIAGQVGQFLGNWFK